MIYSSVIIPTMSRADQLADSLDSLALQTDQNFETIVVCDGEDERTRALSTRYVATYPIRWIFNSRNLGPSSARNIGAENAQGEVIVFLDDDCLPVPDWLSQHCKHHRQNACGEQIVIVGSLQETYVHPPSSTTERMLRKASGQALADFDERCSRRGKDVSWFPHCGLNSSIRRDTFRMAGGFDITLRFAEDRDLGARLLARGVRLIYEPGAVVCHRDPKNVADCRPRDAELCGQTDAYRVCQKGQRTTLAMQLFRLHKAKGIRKVKEHVAWQYPGAVQRIGNGFQMLTDLTGSNLSFRVASSLIGAAGYWKGVRSNGITLNSLREVIGWPLPVLMFHSISVPADRQERAHRMSPRRFRRFVEWLSKANYKTSDPSEWLSSAVRSRHVLLTFDDGYDNFYSEAFAVLQQYKFTATVFVVVDRIGATNSWDKEKGFRSQRLLSLSQIRELHRYGISIGSHSLNHAWLPGLSDADLRSEVEDSKRRLEDILGAEVICFAYPGGGMDERVQGMVAQAGYKLAMTIEPGLSFGDDPLAIKRIGLSEQDGLVDFISKIIIGRSHRQDALALLQDGLYTGVRALPRPVKQTIKQTVHWLRTEL